MGEVLGKLEQAVLAWTHFTTSASRERRLSAALLLAMLSVLSDLLLAARDQPKARALQDPCRGVERA